VRDERRPAANSGGFTAPGNTGCLGLFFCCVEAPQHQWLASPQRQRASGSDLPGHLRPVRTDSSTTECDLNSLATASDALAEGTPAQLGLRLGNSLGRSTAVCGVAEFPHPSFRRHPAKRSPVDPSHLQRAIGSGWGGLVTPQRTRLSAGLRGHPPAQDVATMTGCRSETRGLPQAAATTSQKLCRR
jgi:hypothetical protein